VKQNTLIGLLVLLMLVFVAFMGYKEFIKPQQVQPVQPGVQPQPQGYTPFPLGTLAIYVKDAANPSNIVTTSTVKGKVFSISTPDSAIASPITAYLDSDTIDTSTGKLEFTAKKVMTANSYKVKIWDDSSTPIWYPELVVVNIPALAPELGASAQHTAEDVLLSKIGTFADPMQVEATGSGGGALQTGVTSSATNNKVTINITQVTDSTITIRFEITLANIGVGAKLKNVVLRPIQDTTNPLPTTAFTAASLVYKEGTNFNAPSDILSYVTGQTPISLGDWGDGTSGKYYLTVSLSKSALANGNKFYFRLDDLGNWLATDPIAGQSGASSVNFYIEVIA
jgi:hypothetical protein